MTSRSIPDIKIVPVRLQTADLTRLPSINPAIGQLADLRTKRVEEFLVARSLAPKSQVAYRQDLNRWLDWTDRNWEDITPRQVAQFKQYLLRPDPETNQRVLSDATVNRTLGTLKNFYG